MHGTTKDRPRFAECYKTRELFLCIQVKIEKYLELLREKLDLEERLQGCNCAVFGGLKPKQLRFVESCASKVRRNINVKGCLYHEKLFS